MLMKTLRITILLLLLSISSFLSAQTQVRDQEKEQRFEKQLASVNPLLVEHFKMATKAMDENNLYVADSLFSIVYAGAPTFDPAIRRLGSIKVQMGKISEGLALCEKAIAINKCSDNIISYASSLLNSGNGGEVLPENLNKAYEILKEGQNLPGGDSYEYPVLLCQVSLQNYDEYEFKKSATLLLAKHSDQLAAHYYGAILAVKEENWVKAKDEIELAGEMGLSKEAVKEFLDSGVQSKVNVENYKRIFLWLIVAWAGGLLLLYLLGLLLSNITLRAIERQLKSGYSNPQEKRLRRLYRFMINMSGVYYYVSLPIILVLLVILVVGVFYLFLLVGRIPIQLMLILVVGAGISIYGMVRSLLVKVKYEDPGRKLAEEEAPGLYALVRDVANKIGTRSVDEIRITPLSDLAVYERGSWRVKMQDNAERVLILGVGVLADFKLADFKAVIAHEYGHFSHRDTAGGDAALRVIGDMHKYFVALYSAGQAVWWNVAFQFLRLYDNIFRKISHGATRLQEVLADRVAAQTYGAKAFQDGLTYVIKKNLEFIALANQEIEVAKLAYRPLNNLYELKSNSNISIEDELNAALNRKTTTDDTHPSPIDRFRYVAAFTAVGSDEESTTVRDLIVNWKSITEEMTKIIETRFT